MLATRRKQLVHVVLFNGRNHSEANLKVHPATSAWGFTHKGGQTVLPNTWLVWEKVGFQPKTYTDKEFHNLYMIDTKATAETVTLTTEADQPVQLELPLDEQGEQK